MLTLGWPSRSFDDLGADFDQKFSHLKGEFSDDQARSSPSLVKKLKSETNLTFKFIGKKKQFEFNTETLEYVSQSLAFVQSLKSIVDLEHLDNQEFSALILKLDEARPLGGRINSLGLPTNLKLAGLLSVDEYLSDIHTELTIIVR